MASSIKATFNQLHTKGVQDIELSDNPQASAFTYQFKRIPNFAQHKTMQQFTEAIGFGKTVTINIENFGDLLSGLELYIRLPPLPLASGSTYTGWTNSVGYVMIDTVEFVVGGVTLVRQTGLMMEAYDYITTPMDKRAGLDIMTGRFDTTRVLPIDALGTRDIYVPLRFWFTKKLSQSFPLFLAQKHPVQVRIKLRPFHELVTYDGTTPPPEMAIMDAGMIATYTVLSDEDKASLTSHPSVSYLFEQYQTQVIQEISDGAISIKIPLDVSNVIKELVWVFVETDSEANNDWTNFGRRDTNAPGGELMLTAGLLVNSLERQMKLPESYWRLVETLNHHARSSTDRNIYCMSFSQAPEANQPSGTLNASLYDTIELTVDFIPNLPRCRFYSLAVSYNTITFTDGEIKLTYL